MSHLAKLAAVLTVSGVVSAVFVGSGVMPYVRMAADTASTTVADNVSVETQLKTARNLLDNELNPELTKLRTSVAKARVEIKSLEENLARRQSQVADHRADILTRKDQVESNNVSFVIGNVSYTKDEIKDDLTNRFERFKVVEGTLKSESKVLKARKAALSQQENRISEMLASKTELIEHIEQLEARLEAVRTSEVIAGQQVDDSALKSVQEMLASAESKLAVREEVATLSDTTTDLIPVNNEAEAVMPIEKQVAKHFGLVSSDTETASVE